MLPETAVEENSILVKRMPKNVKLPRRVVRTSRRIPRELRLWGRQRDCEPCLGCPKIAHSLDYGLDGDRWLL